MTCNIINWPHQLTQHFPTLFTSETGYGMWARLTNMVWEQLLLFSFLLGCSYWSGGEMKTLFSHEQKGDLDLQGSRKAMLSFVSQRGLARAHFKTHRCTKILRKKHKHTHTYVQAQWRGPGSLSRCRWGHSEQMEVFFGVRGDFSKQLTHSVLPHCCVKVWEG